MPWMATESRIVIFCGKDVRISQSRQMQFPALGQFYTIVLGLYLGGSRRCGRRRVFYNVIKSLVILLCRRGQVAFALQVPRYQANGIAFLLGIIRIRGLCQPNRPQDLAAAFLDRSSYSFS